MLRKLVLALLLTAWLLLPAAAADAAGATFVVTKTADTAGGACDGSCSLREAITAANAAPGPDTIAFSIPAASDAGCSQSTGVCSIEPLSTLPEIIDPVTIDGYTQPGASINTDAVASNAALKIELDGSSSIVSVGLDVGAGETTVRGLIVNRYAYVYFHGAGNNVVEGNFIGTDAAGEAGLSGGGLSVGAGASGTRIGGVTPSARNVISGNSWGIALDSVQDVAVQGNLIGTNAAGAAAIPNLLGGVLIYSGSSNTIGGNTAAARNVISGNGTEPPCCTSIGGPGIEVDGAGAAANSIQGNYIGLDVSGASALGNLGPGIALRDDGVQTAVGGDVAGAGNVISANGLYGVYIGGTVNPVNNNVIKGNLIGTDASGLADIGNAHGGVFVGNSGNVIGGTTVPARNVLSGNDGPGVVLIGHGNLVQGNFIGTDITGMSALGTVSDESGSAPGIQILGSHSNTIGGDAPGSGNLISGNDGEGILVIRDPPFIPAADDTIVQGNRIGTRADGVAPLGNGSHGMRLFESNNNTVGGATPPAGNVIAHNAGDGIRVESGTGNRLQGNSIRDNAGLGINLGVDGPTVNDAGDADTGPNGMQNFPVISSAVADGGTLTVEGLLHTDPDSTFTIEFFSDSACDPSGYGEGESNIGATSATTNGAGDGAFSVALSGSVAGVLTATATDPSGNTSEFSQCSSICGVEDSDCDGVMDFSDNCPEVANIGQEDTDDDGFGDACDNCPTVANTLGQTADVDGDVAGDACDAPGSGNVDCSGPLNGVSAVDALKVLRYVAGLSVSQNEPCLDIGQPRQLAAPDDVRMGDVDCSGVANAADALKILRAVAWLSVAKPSLCPEVRPPP